MTDIKSMDLAEMTVFFQRRGAWKRTDSLERQIA